MLRRYGRKPHAYEEKVHNGLSRASRQDLMIVRHTRCSGNGASSGSTVNAAEYSVKELLRDGSRIEIRALQLIDRDELQNAVGRMSDESLQRRFFAPKRYFSEHEIDYY